jgi:competence protein ComEC
LFAVTVLPQDTHELSISGNSASSTRKFIAALNSYRFLLTSLQKQNTTVVEVDASMGVIPLADGLLAEIIAPSAKRANLLFGYLTDLYRSFPSSAYNSSFAKKTTALDAALNGFSLTLMLTYQGEKIFLPGDATPESLSGNVTFRRALKSDTLRCDVLKVAHHGQIDGVTEEFITAVSPKIIVTCSSSDRRYQSARHDLYKRIDIWLKQKPVYLFTDAINIRANTLYREPHSAVVITFNSNTLPAQWVHDFVPVIF